MTPSEAQELARLGLAMRQLQREYFDLRKRRPDTLERAKEAERAFDLYLEGHFRPRPAGLFDDWSAPEVPEIDRESEAAERHARERFERIGTARAAIVAVLGPWKGRCNTVAGRIDCPVCGVADALAYRRAGSNGHISARCDSPDCVAWME